MCDVGQRRTGRSGWLPPPRKCDHRSVEKHEADLLRLTRDIDRDTGTLKFLYRGSELQPDQFEPELGRLVERGWLHRNAAGRWRITPMGEEALRVAEDWEFTVEEIFRPSMRPRALVVGVLRRGDMHRDDHFSVRRAGEETGSGRIETIELVTNRSRPDVFTITTSGAELQPGDVLNRWEPMAR